MKETPSSRPRRLRGDPFPIGSGAPFKLPSRHREPRRERRRRSPVRTNHCGDSHRRESTGETTKDVITNIATAAVILALCAPLVAVLVALSIRIFRKLV